ncbi:PKD domain-containing protein, partial [Geodermatophilus sp. SYSU D00708]
MASNTVPRTRSRALRRAGSTAVCGALTAGLVVMGVATPGTAAADTRPPAGTPATVAADALGTVQVDGVVWSMATVGNTVYATGSFKTARPAGAAPGVNTTPRANLLAFDIRTGALITTFNHTLNGQGRTVVASPDGSRIYVGGDFTTVDGVARGHVAAFETATGRLVTGFAPTINKPVYSLLATKTTVYAGGDFTTAGGQTRTRLASFNATTGALTAWAPTANSTVRAMVLDPTGSRLLFGGQFDQVNGVSAIALASVDATTGGNTDTWDYGITNAGDNGGVFSLETDGVHAYANVYGFQVGNFEGTVALDPTTLELVWMNDCHGDPYDTWSNGTVVYQAGHTHDCETSGYFPDSAVNSIWKRGIAMSVETTGILKATTQVPRYGSWEGRPHPAILDWFPTMNAGTVTGQAQGPWTVTGGGNYVVYGGEFTTVNGQPQQALVRFADPSVAPNKRGPEVSAAGLRPNATSTTAGSVRLTWNSAWDMDNEELTYKVYRGSETTPVHTVTTRSQWWNTPPLSYTDTRPAGSTASYRVAVSDPFGNTVTSSVSNTVTVAATTSAYATRVLADGPAQYWRLGEPSGSTAYDHVGLTNLTEGAGITRGTAGAVPGDTAVTANGTATGIAATGTTVSTPGNAFSVEAWVRTTSTAGGVIAQYGEANPPKDDVANTDRALYVDSGGRLSFGLTARGQDRVTRYTTVRSSAPVNDGKWHHVVATVGAGGTTLYVDGEQVAANPTLTRANTRVGPAYWMVGTGILTGAPDAPSSASLNGSVDEVAVYPATLSAEQVAAHHAAADAAAPAPNVAPTAAFTAAAEALAVSVDGSGSADADGSVASYAWDFGDGATGTGRTASHTYRQAGTYPVRLTVTDDDGATATTSRQVTVTAPPTGGGEEPPAGAIAADAFGRTVSAGLGTADVGGAWTASVGASRLSVTPGTAVLGLPGAGNNTGAYLGDVSLTDADVRAKLALSAAPVGGPVSMYVVGRRVDAANEYAVNVKVAAGGQVSLLLSRVAGNVEAWPGGEVVVPGLTYRAGTVLNVRVQVSGTGTTTVKATVWAEGSAEPTTPQLTRTDTTTGLQKAGSVGLAAYRAGSSTAATAVRVTSFAVTPVGAGSQPQNAAPTAAFTAAAEALAVSVDGSGSADADGSVASYAWDFGDGATGTGRTASHTYGQAGTYPVRLTVTDDRGATATTTRSVTVVAPAPPADPAMIAADAFGRTVSAGLGTADVGGAWTASAGASRLSVTPGTAVLGLPGAGNNTGAYLGDVSVTDADVRAKLALSAAPVGGPVSMYVVGRRVDAANE